MTTRDELDALSSRELHDLAVRRALHHVDVEFLWNLLRAIPAAEASEGHDAEAGRDITKVTALLGDAIDSGEGDVAEALRPLYIDYLAKHGTGSLAGARRQERGPGCTRPCPFGIKIRRGPAVAVLPGAAGVERPGVGLATRTWLMMNVGRRPGFTVSSAHDGLVRHWLVFADEPYSGLSRTPSISREIVTFSLTATPPPGIGPL